MSLMMVLTVLPILKASLIKVEAKTSYSHYAMACGAYEVDTISDDGQFVKVSCHDDFSSANNAMKNYTDAVVRHAQSYSANQIIAMTRGYAYSYGNRDDLSTLTITQDLNDWTAKTTYISNYRMMYYEQTRSYNGDGTGTVAVNAYGFEGNVELKDVDMIPAKFVDRGIEIWIGGNDISSEKDPDWVLMPKRPYYSVEQSGNYIDLVYHCYGSQTRTSSTEAWDISFGGIHVGPAASWMKVGDIYYSWDDINYYSDSDLKNYVNTYYNYYQFLPLRTKSNISADVYNSFLAGNGYNSSSKLWDSGSEFLADQEQYGINAAMVFAQACVESGYGTSDFAVNRNNLFGVNAFDSDPGKASYYSSVKSSIDNQTGLLLRQYADVENHLFFGSHFGNKGSGITVKYASSVYYGLTLSAMYYSLDKYSTGYSGALTDWQSNCVGVLNDTNTQIYSSSDGSHAMFETCYSPSYQKNFTVSILGAYGDYYKVQSTDYVQNGDLMHVDNYDTRSTYYDYNWTSMIGYVKKSDVKYIAGTVPFIAVTSISLDNTLLNLKVGDTSKLNATVSPGDAGNKNVTWSSSNSNVVTVDSSGNIKSVAEGNANIIATSASDSSKTATCSVNVSNAEGVAMYRLCNLSTNEHLYTASTSERDSLVNGGKWVYEGVGWTAPKISNTPVYRLYNPVTNDHHYTTSKSEMDTIISWGWQYEEIGWYSDDSQGVPIYREFNPTATTGTHNYTSNKSENDSLVSKGWEYEGISWYGIKTSSSNNSDPVVATQDMYRLCNLSTNEHLYTASTSERDSLVNGGKWVYEGVAWKAPVTSNTPVYRLYNPVTNDHHYTTSKSEMDTIISWGWQYEEIGWYSDDSQGVPVYRQYNPSAITGTHNYTANKSENDYLISKGWQYEGISWCGVK